MREAFVAAGIAATGLDGDAMVDEPVDLAIGSAAALRRPPPSMAIAPWDRRTERAWSATGRSVGRLLVLGGPLAPRLVLPLGQSRVVAARSHLVVGSRLAAATVASGLRRLAPRLPGRTFSVIDAAGPSGPGHPWLVEEAIRRRLDTPVDWYLHLGVGDVLQRSVFVLFAPGDRDPTWVVKFTRVGGHHEPYAREAAATRALRVGARRASQRAALQLDWWTSHGLPASIEPAAPGRPVHLVLGDRRRSRRWRMSVVDAIAAWAVALGVETAGGTAGELFRGLEDDHAEHRPLNAVGPDIRRELDGVPTVMAHHDLGPWNILWASSTFTVVDWESSSPSSLPLWDLLYFLTAALSTVDAAPAAPTRAGVLDLLRGRSRSSPVLFQWLARGAGALGISPGTVGPLATLCWLHHARSRPRRTALLEGLVHPQRAPGDAIAGDAPTPVLGDLGVAWMGDPCLGPRWAAFMRSVAGGD
jgi:hypothetical protein